MKKIISCALMIFMIACLTGCGVGGGAVHDEAVLDRVRRTKFVMTNTADRYEGIELNTATESAIEDAKEDQNGSGKIFFGSNSYYHWILGSGKTGQERYIDVAPLKEELKKHYEGTVLECEDDEKNEDILYFKLVLFGTEGVYDNIETQSFNIPYDDYAYSQEYDLPYNARLGKTPPAIVQELYVAVNNDSEEENFVNIEFDGTTFKQVGGNADQKYWNSIYSK